MFAQPLYKSSITENSPLGTSVITVIATDKDEGPNGAISYSLGSEDQDHILDIFEIDERSGLITVKGNIDFEEHPVFEIRVQASDRGSPPMTSQCKVLMEVIDLNDNAPEISVTTLIDTVKEDTKLGTAIALVSVVDKDGVVDSQLDREIHSYYNVTIIASDDGKPIMTSTKDFTVFLSD
ncbi:hypothetical protein CCH79_00020982, partial [Gambusia affinis]